MPDPSSRNAFYFGPAGWLYDDWKGIVYPRRVPRGFHALPYLARSVNLVEVNATFYAPVRAEVSQSWLARVAADPGFRFVVKAWERFTHARKGWPPPAEAQTWIDGVQPLVDGGRLAAILLQFPFSFEEEPAARDRILEITELMPGVPLATEFRHASWLTDASLSFLESHGLAFVNIDQPQGADTIPPTAIQTAPLTYVRLHGRNAATWFDRKAHRDARYDYRYRPDEIAEWAARIAGLRESSPTTLVVGNNHYRGQAVAAVLLLAHAVTGETLQVPEPMLDAFPELLPIARPEPGSLF